MFETTIREGVFRAGRRDTRWLATGFDGGYRRADAAYNVSVPEGFDRTDVAAYAVERRAHAGFDAPGPTLLTGVDLTHARGARRGSAVAYATAGLSNPAALPVDASADGRPEDRGSRPAASRDEAAGDIPRGPGTVNLIAGTNRALDRGALASLLATVVEAKTATLQALTGVPGTTTDAVAVGCDPEGEPSAFAGSGTTVGADIRACVREALAGALRARYADPPGSVAEAEYGVVTDRRAEVFDP